MPLLFFMWTVILKKADVWVNVQSEQKYNKCGSLIIELQKSKYLFSLLISLAEEALQWLISPSK